MRIDSAKLKELSRERGVAPDALAAAVVRTGLGGRSALSAVGNWMKGRDHPRCRPEDVAKLAGALQCEPKDLVRFVSVSRFQRSSPRKAELVADLIRGKRVDKADELLTFSKRRAAKMIKKTLDAARSDAQNSGADMSTLHVVEARVDAGVIIKRFQPKDRGRAHPIMKRTSHLTIGVKEVA